MELKLTMSCDCGRMKYVSPEEAVAFSGMHDEGPTLVFQCSECGSEREFFARPGEFNAGLVRMLPVRQPKEG